MFTFDNNNNHILVTYLASHHSQLECQRIKQGLISSYECIFMYNFYVYFIFSILKIL